MIIDKIVESNHTLSPTNSWLIPQSEYNMDSLTSPLNALRHSLLGYKSCTGGAGTKPFATMHDIRFG